MYLVRRIERLLTDLRAGRTVLTTEVAETLQPHIDAVRHHPDGSIDLASCSDDLRSFARAYYLAATSSADSVASVAPASDPPPSPSRIVQLNRELFAHFEAVFVAFTGKAPEKFADDDDSFAAAVRSLGSRMSENRALAAKRLKAGNDALVRLVEHYKQTNMERMSGARAATGARMVLGGTQRFTSSPLAAARSMLLYTDTLLVPDPVFPWLEIARPEERFATVRLYEQIFYLSRLRPLVDADLPYPAVLVFPSFEKLLEQNDPVTQDGQELLYLRFFSHCLGRPFDAMTEVVQFARSHANEFAARISESRALFVPGATGQEPFSEAIRLYREYIQESRSREQASQLAAMADVDLATLSIMERLGPQFHVQENSELFSAAPLFSQAAHWHYFRLLRTIETAALVEQNVVQPSTDALAQALTAPSNAWLGNVPINHIVELRARLENETFRRKLDGYMKELGAASESDVDSVAANVSRALRSLLVEHRNDVQRITDEYQRRHVQTAVGTWITLGALLLPWFPVVAQTAALVGIGKYAAEKATEKYHFKKQSRTLLGCLAAAASKSDA